MRSHTTRIVRAMLLAMLVQAPALQATELVYTPVNPSFGGSPLNGAVLLNAAQAQNKHTDPKSGPAGGIGGQQTPLQQFNDILERAVLNRLVSAATTSVMGADGKLQPGTVTTGNFTIQITDLGGGLLQVTTTDKVTGASTSFQVGGM
ncbi:curli assembly protein CsgF [Noviherbaspirillum aridicola]|uniref:Curli production assembly/transport component CsgF n=1 Tax=Noviherbaspirillum aridicola TaxID=2849687 RepID=A0ABQ4Q7G5_9BURK|nr:curli assembly protein CsgF [Noviherbaspirillum aridicola]GIZ52989.1 curli production assembly protein CsgF [Noviherbaspirillum aridicola]